VKEIFDRWMVPNDCRGGIDRNRFFAVGAGALPPSGADRSETQSDGEILEQKVSENEFAAFQRNSFLQLSLMLRSWLQIEHPFVRPSGIRYFIMLQGSQSFAIG
jgi:hypothetical protein